MPDQVDATVEAMEPAGDEPMFDRSRGEAGGEQLSARDHPVLLRRDPRRRIDVVNVDLAPVSRDVSSFPTTIGHNDGLSGLPVPRSTFSAKRGGARPGLSPGVAASARRTGRAARLDHLVDVTELDSGTAVRLAGGGLGPVDRLPAEVGDVIAGALVQ